MNGAGTMHETLRQMLAVLEGERQALAGLDLEAILGAASDKHRLCGDLEASTSDILDGEFRAMLEAARRQNEVNRQIRNLIAANVAARIDALAGTAQLYAPGAARSYSIARA